MHDDRHRRLGEQSPHRVKQLVPRVVTAHLQVRLEQPGTRGNRLRYVADRVGLGEEGGAVQGVRDPGREVSRPRVQPGQPCLAYAGTAAR